MKPAAMGLPGLLLRIASQAARRIASAQ